MEGASLQSSLIGATIGNYRVVAKLGEGGMGAVYLAEHPLIGKKVALKVLHEEYAANVDVVSRFFNEAKAVNDIGHPNIVDIIDYGVVQTPHGPGFVYFIMEFLGGEALATVLQREAPLPPERALHVAAQVADALAASHAKGIVHRDLKPDNIFLIQRPRERDFVKVLDFGIAKLTSNDGKSSRTRTGVVMGTPAYMSPEQCDGRGNIDHRTDVYALGIVLYEMITGKVPFAGEGYGEVLVQHLTKVPERPSTIRGVIPPHVEAIVMKALEKKRDDRFQNMEQFIAALRDPIAFVEANGGLSAFYPGSGAPLAQQATMMLGHQTPTPVPQYGSQPGVAPQRPTTLTSGSGEVAGRPISRNKTPILVGAAIGALSILGVGIFFAMKGGKKTTDEEPPVAVAATTTEPAAPDSPPQPEVTKPVETKPVETPAPPPPPALPAKVSINVTSVPAGAAVFVGDEPEPRGPTPIQIDLERGEGEVELRFLLEGYKEKKKRVKTSRDAELEITLEKDRRATPATKPDKDRDRPKDDKKKDDKRKDFKPMPVDDDDVLAPTFE